MSKKLVRKAVIPAAGLGTRFLPATKVIPKEMIPIVDVPMIQYNIQEAVDAGIEEIILITARNKESIEDHFDYNYELDDVLEKRGKIEQLELSRKIAEMCTFVSVRQLSPLGLGHAVLRAELVVGNEPFAVLLGDDIVDSKTPCIGQLIDIFNKTEKSVVGVMNVDRAETKKYGIVDAEQLEPRLHRVRGVVEKPNPDSAPSTLAIPGRYVLRPEIFSYLKKTKPGAGGEIQLTDALAELAKAEGMYAYEFEGIRYDAGDHLGLIEATIAFGLKRDLLRDGIQKILKKYITI